MNDTKQELRGTPSPVRHNPSILPELRELQEAIHGTACRSGWWDESASAKAIRNNEARLIQAGILSPQQVEDLITELVTPNFGEKISLMHAELSEALEADRNAPPEKLLMSKAIPEFFHKEEELADCIIRILDFAKFHNLDVIGAMVAKAAFNNRRPFKHGGKNY